jgi:ankyrin repeat-rich membrane spanning protein
VVKAFSSIHSFSKIQGGLNTQEDGENLLGYNLYSSALADMLSDPTLNMPITVGLFARWGSGKSFLLSKLRGNISSLPTDIFS